DADRPDPVVLAGLAVLARPADVGEELERPPVDLDGPRPAARGLFVPRRDRERRLGDREPPGVGRRRAAGLDVGRRAQDRRAVEERHLPDAVSDEDGALRGRPLDRAQLDLVVLRRALLAGRGARVVEEAVPGAGDAEDRAVLAHEVELPRVA